MQFLALSPRIDNFLLNVRFVFHMNFYEEYFFLCQNTQIAIDTLERPYLVLYSFALFDIIIYALSILFYLMVHVCQLTSVMSDSVGPHGLQPTRLLCPQDFPGKNAEVGCHTLLQGNLSDPGIKPMSSCILHWQVSSLPLVPFGKFLYLLVMDFKTFLFLI